MSIYLNQQLSRLVPYTPGEQSQDRQFIKLNTNESPYPPPPAVMQAFTQTEMENLRLYSDPQARRLKQKLAKQYGVESENVFVTNGSDEALCIAFMAYAKDGRGVAFPDIGYGFYSVFADLYGTNKDFLKQGHLITFTDTDGSLKALRPDVTLSIIKNNTGNSEKVYYNETVYREVNGTFREILQVGIESVGQIDPYAEAEVLVLAASSLEEMGQEYVLDLSDISFVDGICTAICLPNEMRARVFRMLAQKNAPAIQQMQQQGTLTQAQADAILQLMDLYLPLKAGIAKAGELVQNREGWQSLRQLSLVADILQGYGLDKNVRLDFSLVNNMDYYNGLIFQGFLPNIPLPVLCGGRYDNLPRKMGKQVGAIGFAIDMSLPKQHTPTTQRFDADILLTYKSDTDLTQLAAFAAQLRASGKSVRCECEFGKRKMHCKKQICYRDRMKAEEVAE